jgi:hypothetical protein
MYKVKKYNYFEKTTEHIVYYQYLQIWILTEEKIGYDAKSHGLATQTWYSTNTDNNTRYRVLVP